MSRWLSFLFWVFTERLRHRAKISLAAYVKFPAHVRLGKGVIVRSGAMIDAPGPHLVTLDVDVSLNRGVYLGGFDRIDIGARTQLNRLAHIDARGPVRIGCDVLIGPFACLIAYQHIHADVDVPINRQGVNASGIAVEDDVWIGAGATVLDGVTIGKGSIVGAGAVVTKSVPPGSIVAGVPARVIGRRGQEQGDERLHGRGPHGRPV